MAWEVVSGAAAPGLTPTQAWALSLAPGGAAPHSSGGSQVLVTVAASGEEEAAHQTILPAGPVR